MSESTEALKDDKVWMVLYTRPRYEKKVDIKLTSKGIESYCPTKKVEKQWTDRKKIIDEVIFRSYVFVRINESESLTVLETDGVMNFIRFNKQPAVVRDEEIDIIKRFLNDSATDVNVISSSEFEPNTKVRINHGIFMDNKGTIVKSNKKKVYVQLESMAQVMVIEFPIDHVIPLN